MSLTAHPIYPAGQPVALPGAGLVRASRPLHESGVFGFAWPPEKAGQVFTSSRFQLFIHPFKRARQEKKTGNNHHHRGA